MAELTRGGLFHVPFELRHKIASKRYSISGLPSLYLSGSIWACWEEMQRPDFHTIQLSRFRYSKPAKILDFGFRPSSIAQFRAQNSSLLSDAEVTSYVICWPLIAACSVCAYLPGMPFIPEYIVPQLLLQWIRSESSLDGLRYFSTKINQDRHSPWAAMNYVFPVQEQVASGYCPKLKDKFVLTSPASWSILTNSDFSGVPMEVPGWSIPVNEDYSVKYSHTEFFKCERKLDDMPCAAVI